MTLKDFEGMHPHATFTLLEWAYNGKAMKVRSLYDEKTRKSYQVCDEYNVYRETEPATDKEPLKEFARTWHPVNA